MSEPRLVLQVVDRTSDVQDEEIHPDVQIRVVTIAGLTKLSAEDCDRVAGIILSNEKKLSKAAITALKKMQNLREAQIHDTHVLASFFESDLIAPIVKLATSEKKVRFPQGRYPNLSELILNGRSVDFSFDPIQFKSLERLTISPSASQAKNSEFWDRVGRLEKLSYLRIQDLSLPSGYVLPTAQIGSLVLSKPKVSDLIALRDMAKLNDLWILNPSRVIELDELACLANLRSLRIQTSRAFDLAPLLSLPALEALTVSKRCIGDGQGVIDKLSVMGIRVKVLA